MGVVMLCVLRLEHEMFDIRSSFLMMPVKSLRMTVKAHWGMKLVTGEQYIWLGEESVNTGLILLALEESQ